MPTAVAKLKGEARAQGEAGLRTERPEADDDERA
jgi:hypothetical protein